MSGHSKWNNIKNRKGAQDKAKSKIFSQLSRLIRAATKQANSGDPKSNPSLRLILDKARMANMPNAKVQKAIDVALGKGNASQIQEIVYEGFGPGGVGMMIVALTDNLNRSSSEIRFALSKAGGSLGSPGSARYMFERNQEGEFIPTMKIPVSKEDLVKLMELADNLRDNEDVEDVFLACDILEEE
ncbi:YebC/PmpR family DNA-binding transcriptional regulator [Patescibacteria group bacterium]|nr:YebC/PmpR family DNA-binding transcriptional regulator [Patescibacteria group bacterium]